MCPRPVILFLLAALAGTPWTSRPLLAEGDPAAPAPAPVPAPGPAPAPPAGAAPGAAAAPAQDNRFFPKEMEDALAAMKGPDPEDSFTFGLGALARLRLRDGAPEPMRQGAFAPILEHGLSTRLEHVASYAGEILAALDVGRLCSELSVVVDKEQDEHRLFNAAVMLEEGRWNLEGKSSPDPVDSLVRLAGRQAASLRTRAAEALGEIARPRRGCPEKSRDKALTTLLALYGSAGKDFELKNVCAIALGKIGSPRAKESLLSGLGRTEGRHCFAAALALSWIEDPTIFPTLLGGSGFGAGEEGEAYCKALEGCARPGDVEALVNLVVNSGKPDVREAAGVALARLLPLLPAPGPDGKPAGATPLELEQSALRAKAASVLFEAVLNDKNSGSLWACFHALSTGGGPWLEVPTVKLLYSPNPGTVVRAIHLSGDWKLKSAAKPLGGAIFSEKDEILRRRIAIEFWRIGDREAIDEFKKKVKDSSGGVPFSRGCEALGLWRCKEAFDFAQDLLRSTRDKSPDQFAVDQALEVMTGHLFDSSPGIWNKWFEKNPNFFNSRQAKIERERWREDFDKENKGYRQTKETEKAVQMGLEYLARHQAPDGRWDPEHYRERCDRSPPCSASTGSRVGENPSGRTGLAILAFLGAGYTPEAGKFKTAIRRGLEWLMACQQACGDYYTNDLIGGYNRPVALQAYAEACAVTHDPVYLPFVQRGADFLTQIQNSIGGWRYRVIVETSDSSVAAWMLFAMKAAEKAGARVRPIVFEGTRVLFERYSSPVPQNAPREEFVDIDPSYGFEVGKTAKYYEYHTGYQNQSFALNQSPSAIGLMSHILLGYRRSHPFCIGSANLILAKQLPQVPKDGNLERVNLHQEYPMYFLYYGTLAMHQMGGAYFRKWNDQVRVILPGIQVKEGCGRGSWKGQDYDGFFGSLYTTGMGVLALETYYRYLPVLQD